jgi:hypothetical protein
MSAIDRAVLDVMLAGVPEPELVLDGPSAYRIISNFTELEVVATLAAAKRRAIDESLAYEDIVVIERGARDLYMARYGRLYRLVGTR